VRKKSTYRAVQAVSPGKLGADRKASARSISRFMFASRVEACGVCHSDSATVEGVLPIEVAEGARPRSGRPDRRDRRERCRAGSWTQRVGRRLLGGNCEYLRLLPATAISWNCTNQGYTGCAARMAATPR